MRAKVDEFTRGIAIITDHQTGRFLLKTEEAEGIPEAVTSNFIAALNAAKKALPSNEFDELMQDYSDKHGIKRAIWVNPLFDGLGVPYMMMGGKIMSAKNGLYGYRIISFDGDIKPISEYCYADQALQKQRLYMMTNGHCNRSWCRKQAYLAKCAV